MSGLSAIAPILLTGMGMIGGCMWPLEIINSKVLLFMANLTPHKWALESIENLIITGEIQIKSVLIILFMGIGYLFVGSFVYKRKTD
jgi:ABC-2 type transport system permease protein